MPSGSLANQIGMRLHVAPGEEVLADSLAHVLRAEMGRSGQYSRHHLTSWVAPRGLLDLAQPLAMMQPDAGAYQVSTRLVVVENTHNFGGGTIQPLPAVRAAAGGDPRAGRGPAPGRARLWNACVATGTAPRRTVRLFDTVSVCLSRPRRPGLGSRAGHGRSGASAMAAGCARRASWPPVGGGG